jgi:hypothetical protein
VNIRDPSSLSSANYSGALIGSYPPLSSGGRYNASKNRVVFEEKVVVPFLGITLSLVSEVKLDIVSFITELFLLGRLENPFNFDVTGISDDANCGVFLSGYIDLPTQGLAVQAELALDPCDNCSSICSAQDVQLMVHLDLPLNVTLQGTFTLADNNVTELTAAGQIQLSDLPINISVVLQSEVEGQLSVQEVALDAFLQSPFSVDLHGIYSKDTSLVVLSGALDLSVLTLFLELEVDVGSEELSVLQISGNILSPFMMNISGSYDLLVSNSSQISLAGSLDVPGFSNLMGMVDVDLLTSKILGFSFEGMLAEPLSVAVSGDYNISNELELRGGVDLPENGSISAHGLSSGDNLILSGEIEISSFLFAVDVTLNTINALAIQEVNFNVSLDSPFNLSLIGGYSNINGGALVLSGMLDISTLTLALDLAVDIESQTVDSLAISGNISSPFMMNISGSYNLLVSNSSLISLAGSLDVSGLSNLVGMMDIDLLTGEILGFSFEGTLAEPLAVTVSGDYSIMDQLVLRGDAELPGNGSISGYARHSGDDNLVLRGTIDIDTFHFTVDVTLNTTDMLSIREINLNTSLEGPLNLNLHGGYSESSGGTFLLSAMLNISDVTLALELAVDVESQTVGALTFTGDITSPFMMSVFGSYNLLESNSDRIMLAGSLEVEGLSNLTGMIEIDLATQTILSFSFEGVLTGSLAVTVSGEYDITDELVLRGDADLPGNGSLSAHGISSDDNLALSGMIDVDSFHFSVDVIFNTTDALIIQEVNLNTSLDSPFNIDLHGTYSESDGKTILSALLDLSEFTLVLERVDIESQTVDSLLLSSRITSPFEMSVSGSYDLLESNSSQVVVMGALEVPGLSNLTGMLEIDLVTSNFLSFSFEGMLDLPLAVMVSGEYNAETTDELVLQGSAEILENTTINFNARISISEPVSVKEITLDGNFPPPLDFITYSGVYNDLCSCAILAGTVVQDAITASVSANLTFAEDQDIPSINELDVGVTFHALDLMLTGVYRYTNDNSSVVPCLLVHISGVAVGRCISINLVGQFDIPEILLIAELELLLEGTSDFTFTELGFRGTFPPPLSLAVQGYYNTSTNDLVLSGSLSYDFADLNATVIYSIGGDSGGISRFSNVAFIGSLTDPFQLEVEGQYVFATSNFSLRGMLNVSQFVVLEVDISLDTHTSPPTIDVVNLAGTLTTPISLEGNFEGTYSSETREALLCSNLEVAGALFLNATARLTLEENNEFTFQSVDINGVLDSPLLAEVTAVYDLSDTPELELMGSMSIGPVSFLVAAYADSEDGTANLTVKEVTVSGIIEDPFNLTLSGSYVSGDVLLLNGLTDQDHLRLMVTAPVNLSTMPREISAFQFNGELTHPFNATLSGGYSSDDDELVLFGMIDVDTFCFTVDITLNTTDGWSIQEMNLNTSLESPFNVDLRGTYSESADQTVLSAVLGISEITLSMELAVSIETQSVDSLMLSASVASPFTMSVSGSYDLLESKSDQIMLAGSLDVDGISNFIGMIEIDLAARTILGFSFEGALAEPLAVTVLGRYNTETLAELVLRGFAELTDNSTINVNVKLNTSEPVSVKEIFVDGNFPPPLDFISYSGQYSDQCSCATVTGAVVQDSLNVMVATNLTFDENQANRPSISDLEIQFSLHSSNLLIAGIYRYSRDDNNDGVDTGILSLFDIPQFALSTELILLLEGMSQFTFSESLQQACMHTCTHT